MSVVRWPRRRRMRRSVATGGAPLYRGNPAARSSRLRVAVAGAPRRPVISVSRAARRRSRPENARGAPERPRSRPAREREPSRSMFALARRSLGSSQQSLGIGGSIQRTHPLAPRVGPPAPRIGAAISRVRTGDSFVPPDGPPPRTRSFSAATRERSLSGPHGPPMATQCPFAACDDAGGESRVARGGASRARDRSAREDASQGRARHRAGAVRRERRADF
jgi:hypothetical protein